MNNLSKRNSVHHLINKEIELLNLYNKNKDDKIKEQLEAVRRLQVKLLDKRIKS